MDVRSISIFSIFLLCPVHGQVMDNRPDDFILVANSGNMDVYRMDINNNYSYVVIPFQNWFYPRDIDIDYDPIDAVIYWVDEYWQIHSGSIFGNNEKTVRSLNGTAQLYGIAVDSISRLLFYTDMGNDIIAVVSLEDSLQKTVISSGLVNPRAIVTDPINGTIYWTDSGSPAKIEKSNYDGTNRQEVVNNGLSIPCGLDVDINAGVLYWSDVGTHTIEGANVDGSNRHAIYQDQKISSYCSIALYQSYLYFTIWWSRNAIMRIGTDGSGLISVAPSEIMYPLAIHVNINGRRGINGCSNGSGGCSHFCFPLTDGSKMCACPDLMTLQPDGQTCQNENLPDDFILIADNGNGAVSRMDINNNYSYVSIPFPNRVYPQDIDYDPVDAVIYLVNGNQQINSGSMFGNSEKTVRSLNGIARTYGVAVDSISRLLFYTDMGNDIIAAISLEGYFQKTVISSGLSNPRAIVTDPTNGTIYWVDLGSPAKIEKCNYDGTHRHEVVNTGLSTPYGLDVDINAGVLYWCDVGTSTIEGANVDGSNRHLIYQNQEIIYHCSIALYQSYIYFASSWHRYAIMKIGTDGSGLISVAPSALIYPLAIHVNINGRLGLTECSNRSGGCSHFCFPLPDGSKVCACPDLMNLQPDGQTCRNDNLPDNFLLITDRSKRSIYRMDTNNYSYVNIPLEHISNPYAIDYDPNAAVMFWTDGDLRQINSGSIYGNSQTTLRHLKHYAVLNGIAVDSISRLLFYTDGERNIIAVVSLNDYLQKTVISTSLNTPLAIVTDPTNGTIYWTSHAKIEKSNYDGTNREEVINTGLGASVDLVVDITVGVMYWCDYSTRKIERANVDGSDRQVLYQSQTSLYKCSIALYQSYPTRRTGINGCYNGHRGCSHFCFPRPGGFKVCDCPDGMTLQPDGLTCGNSLLYVIPPVPM